MDACHGLSPRKRTKQQQQYSRERLDIENELHRLALLLEPQTNLLFSVGPTSHGAHVRVADLKILSQQADAKDHEHSRQETHSMQQYLLDAC